MGYIATALICLWLGYQVGWTDAHTTVAKECDRLGGFYVGKKVYRCELDPIQPKE